MSWQIVIWNIFIWTFTGAMITLNHASLWWLLISALFTAWNNGSELMKKHDDLNSKVEELTRIIERNERL